MNQIWEEKFSNSLNQRKNDTCYRTLQPIEKNRGYKIAIAGKEYINFSSNDYLSLSFHPALIEAGYKSLTEWGSGSGGSRLTAGNNVFTEEVESLYAAFLGRARALLFSSGYHANCGTIAAMADRDTIIFTDKLNHASIYDGIILSRAKYERYPHRDMQALQKLCQKYSANKKKIIISDAVFSMDGDLAPLVDIVEIARKYSCFTIVDEAHSFGIFGKEGEGLAAELGLSKEIDIIIGTLGKAFGLFGAVVFADDLTIDYLINHCRTFIFTTALPPFIIGALKRTLSLVREEKRGKLLLQKAKELIKKLNSSGIDTIHSESMIIPILTGNNQTTLDLMNLLMASGFFIPAIRPPTVPHNMARLRLSLCYDHKEDDLVESALIIKDFFKRIKS